MISNWPVTTEMSYRKTAATTIHAIFNPNAAPNTKPIADIDNGIVKTALASNVAVIALIIAAQCGLVPRTASR